MSINYQIHYEAEFDWGTAPLDASEVMRSCILKSEVRIRGLKNRLLFSLASGSFLYHKDH